MPRVNPERNAVQRAEIAETTCRWSVSMMTLQHVFAEAGLSTRYVYDF